MAGKKITARNLLKYSGIFLLCGWMFFLGVLVGRGTAPVSFDTKKFQEKLAEIAGVKVNEKKIEKKSGLDFYEMLKKPVSTMDAKFPESLGKDGAKNDGAKGNSRGKISEKSIQIKKSRKTMSMALLHGGKKRHESDLKPVNGKITALSLKNNFHIPKKIKKSEQINSSYKNIKHGEDFNADASDETVVYTIQIAAYRNLNDALKLMENLKKKGYTAYRTMGKKGDKLWHRVRIGSFVNRKKAMQFEKQLESKQLKGIIVIKGK